MRRWSSSFVYKRCGDGLTGRPSGSVLVTKIPASSFYSSTHLEHLRQTGRTGVRLCIFRIQEVSDDVTSADLSLSTLTTFLSCSNFLQLALPFSTSTNHITTDAAAQMANKKGNPSQLLLVALMMACMTLGPMIEDYNMLVARNSVL